MRLNRNKILIFFLKRSNYLITALIIYKTRFCIAAGIWFVYIEYIEHVSIHQKNKTFRLKKNINIRNLLNRINNYDT